MSVPWLAWHVAARQEYVSIVQTMRLALSLPLWWRTIILGCGFFLSLIFSLQWTLRQRGFSFNIKKGSWFSFLSLNKTRQFYLTIFRISFRSDSLWLDQHFIDVIPQNTIIITGSHFKITLQKIYVHRLHWMEWRLLVNWVRCLLQKWCFFCQWMPCLLTEKLRGWKEYERWRSTYVVVEW